MRPGQSSLLTDRADVRFRLGTVKTGCWLTFALTFFIFIYAFQTWHVGHRLPILILVGCCDGFSILLLTVVPLEAIIVGRWRETFFMCWSFTVILVIIAAGLLDKQTPSPLLLPLYMPLIFAGMSYPIRTGVVVATTTLLGYLLVCIVNHESLAYAGLMLSCLTWTSCMALWQAHNRNSQRRELEQHRDDLAHASRVDPLTGALNRRGFEERLGAELAEASRAGRPLTLATLDLDHFKAVNDRD